MIDAFIDCTLKRCCFFCEHAKISTRTEEVFSGGQTLRRVVTVDCEHEWVCNKYQEATGKKQVSQIVLESEA